MCVITIAQYLIPNAMNLFVYGTLRAREFIQSLIGHTLDEAVKATMPGFTTVMSQWGYPVMMSAQDSSVEGIVWRGLREGDFIILDRYEGCDAEAPVYRREKRMVIITGREEEAWAYLGTSAFLTQVCDKEKEHKF